MIYSISINPWNNINMSKTKNKKLKKSKSILIKVTFKKSILIKVISRKSLAADAITTLDFIANGGSSSNNNC